MTQNDPTPSRTPSFGARLRLFAGVVVVIVAAAVALIVVRRRGSQTTPATPPVASSASASSSTPPAVASAAGPRVFFRDLRHEEGDFGRIAFVGAGDPSAARVSTNFPCVRSHFGSGRGLCLRLAKSAFHRAEAVGIDPTFAQTFVVPLDGLPSRVRVSPDGRLGATTIFVSGHGYDDVDMSTRTNVYDLATGQIVADLEDFALWKDDKKLDAVDRNYWGVTFRRAHGRFFATVETKKTPYLVDGDLEKREVRIVAENVECPSLSPDEKRIAFKQRVGGPGKWRLAVMDLATMAPRLLAEARNVDDQVEWFDDTHILYKEGVDVWILDVDADAPAKPFVLRATSPAVERRG